MHLWAIVRVALRSLAANKTRTFLTMLGVIIGVGSVIAMLAIGQGAKNQVSRQFDNLGLTTLSMWPQLKPSGGLRINDAMTLTLGDAEAVRRDLPDVLGSAPEVAGYMQIVRGNRNFRARVVGTTADYMHVRAFTIERGRNFTHEEDEDVRQYCVLGPDAVEELFEPGEDPLGARVKIAGKFFTVIGVVTPKGDNGFLRVDNFVYIPLSVALKRIFGEIPGAGRALNAIHVRMDASGDDLIAKMKVAEQRLERLMRERHNLSPDEPADFKIRNMTEFLRQSEETARTFTLLLAGVAGISLLVGGIGIMNIMVVTVTERTREIGIRKAIGARPWDILKQFIIESLVVSTLGGLLGVALGLGLAELLPKLSEWIPGFPHFETAPTLSSVLLSFGFAAAVGVVFGWYPARKAARLNTIEALRYE